MVTRVSTASGAVGRAVEYLRNLWERREFAIFLGYGNMQARNAGTALGVVWWILNPLLLGGVYFLIFGLILEGARTPDFLVYLMCGMFVFHFTSQSMTGGANSILQNSRLLANLRFPRLILPISALIESGAGFLVSVVVLYAMAAAVGADVITGQVVLLPLAFLLQLIFNLGLGSLAARLAVPFRDINNVIPYLTRIWLYLSPIIWPLTFLDNVEGAARRAVEINPMFSIISIYRAAVLDYPLNQGHVWLAAAWSIGVGVVGVALFVKYEGHIVRHL